MCMTAQHIRDVLAGTSLTQCLASTPAAIHAAVLAHDFYALRQLGWAQEVGKLLVPKKPKKALLYAHLLRSLILLEAAHRWGDQATAGVRPRAAQPPDDVRACAPHTEVDRPWSAP